MNPNDQQIVSALVNNKMGAPQGAAPQQPGAQPAPQAPAKPPEAPPTDQEKAAQQGAPQTEGDKSQAEAIAYEIQFGENDTRKLSPDQIAQTFNRYRDLNYQHAQMKPATDVIQAIMRKYNAGPQEVAQAILNMERAYQKNPPQGPDNNPKQQAPNARQNPGMQSNEDVDAALKKWEEENAATLPPGYKENMAAMQQMQQQNGQLMQMMQALLAGQKGVTDAARGAHQQNQQDRSQQMQMAIANNLNAAQAKTGLSDDDAGPFQVFYAERGYTTEDFVDPSLAMKVMLDYKNSKGSPEMERLQALHQRRQAFTGSIGSTPTGGAPADSPAGSDPHLERLINKRMG